MPTIASRSATPEQRQEPTVGQIEDAPPLGGRTRRRSFDGTSAPPSPARELAFRALDVLRRVRLASPPERWLQPGFGREVDLVRLHLAPVRSRAGLAASYGREAFNLAVDGDWPRRIATRRASTATLTASMGPVDVAYALRWLELGDGHRRIAFREWLANPADPTDSTERTLR